jgi:hypothetical protein
VNLHASPGPVLVNCERRTSLEFFPRRRKAVR